MSRVIDRSGAEEGTILVIVATLLLALLVITALVVDVSQYRSTKRTDQSIADFAALAAGNKLAASGGDDVVGACTDAWHYLQINTPDLPGTASMPCSSLPTTCATSPATSPVNAVATGDSPYTITIEYPVSDSEITDANFSGLATEAGTACQRMKVVVQRSDPPSFSQIIGNGNHTLTASAVVRAFSGGQPNQVAALLLLERSGCGALYASAPNGGVIVQAAASDNPGRIAADSAGIVGSGCTTNTNSGGYVIYGTALSAASGGGPSILAQSSSDGTPGSIQIYATAIGGRGGAVAPSGISPAPKGGQIASRISVDKKYNPAANATITNLHSTAYTSVNGAAPVGYTTISNNGCAPGNNGSNPAVVTITGDLFVNCADFKPKGLVVLTGQHFIFTGKVTVAQGVTLSMPNVTTNNAQLSMYVGGCSTCNGGNLYSVSVAGNFYVNTGVTGGTTTACSNRAGPGAGGTTTQTAVIATFGGPFIVSGGGNLSLCQTMLYLADEKSGATYSAQQITSPTTSPTFCSSDLPCPAGSLTPPQAGDGTGMGYLSITGTGVADWSAPNQFAGVPSPQGLEDLALWEESDQPSTIGGSSTIVTQGVFFLPNTQFSFSGQGTQTNPLNAQFVARALTLSGQGTLFLAPQRPNSVPTQPFTNIYLIH